MDQLQSALNAIGFDPGSFLVFVLIFAAGSILIAGIGRLTLGKRSMLSQSVSSAVGILFVYALSVVLWSMGASLSRFVAPLPFVDLDKDFLYVFLFSGADYTQICSVLLSAITLAFIANLIDGVMPHGKNVFSWLFFRCLTVLLAAIAHCVVSWLLESYLPAGLLTYAPVILLGLLVLLLFVGALKLLIGVLLVSVNPLIAAFYTFFFATAVGKALTKALLTTGLLSVLVLALNYLGVSSVAIDSAALVAYVPFLLILLILWYLVGFLL